VDNSPLEDDAGAVSGSAVKKRRVVWSADEETRLREIIEQQDNGTAPRRDWEAIAKYVAKKSVAQCRHKVDWEVGKARMPKRFLDEDHPLRVSQELDEEPNGKERRFLQWSPERMDALQKAVLKYGTKWVNVARELGMEDKRACNRACRKKFEYEVAAGRMHYPPQDKTVTLSGAVNKNAGPLAAATSRRIPCEHAFAATGRVVGDGTEYRCSECGIRKVVEEL
jgi:hypothetical protein